MKQLAASRKEWSAGLVRSTCLWLSASDFRPSAADRSDMPTASVWRNFGSGWRESIRNRVREDTCPNSCGKWSRLDGAFTPARATPMTDEPLRRLFVGTFLSDSQKAH